MKTFLNPLIAVLLLSSTFLSAQSIERANLYKNGAKAAAFLKEIQKLDSTSVLRNSDRNLDSTYVYERLDEGVLALVSKIIYEYDQSDRIKTVNQIELIDALWIQTLRADLTYEPATNTVITTIFAWDEEAEELVNFARNTETTRDDGQLLFHELALFFGFDYIPFTVTNFSYNNQDLADTILLSNFDIEIFALVPTSRQTFSYNSSGRLLSDLNEIYSIESNEFSMAELVEYVTYDDNDSPLHVTTSFWNAEAESWLLFIDYNYLYTYDNAGRVTKKTTFVTYLGEAPEIDIEEFEYHNTWGEITVYTTSTSSNGILIPLAKEIFEYDNVGNLVLETQISLEVNPEVVLGRQQHFYDGITSSIGSEKRLIFDIRHANPSSSGDAVQISVETTNLIDLTVYDLNGKKVGGKSFRFAENFRLPHLPSGMYILVLQSKGYASESRKILIK